MKQLTKKQIDTQLRALVVADIKQIRPDLRERATNVYYEILDALEAKELRALYDRELRGAALRKHILDKANRYKRPEKEKKGDSLWSAMFELSVRTARNCGFIRAVAEDIASGILESVIQAKTEAGAKEMHATGELAGYVVVATKNACAPKGNTPRARNDLKTTASDIVAYEDRAVGFTGILEVADHGKPISYDNSQQQRDHARENTLPIARILTRKLKLEPEQDALYALYEMEGCDFQKTVARFGLDKDEQKQLNSIIARLPRNMKIYSEVVDKDPNYRQRETGPIAPRKSGPHIDYAASWAQGDIVYTKRQPRNRQKADPVGFVKEDETPDLIKEARVTHAADSLGNDEIDESYEVNLDPRY
jgi:hypothetical protein